MDELKIIIQKLNELEIKIDAMQMELKEIKGGTTKMDRHIDFVDSIYGQIKAPFHYIMEKVGSSIKDTPRRERTLKDN